MPLDPENSLILRMLIQTITRPCAVSSRAEHVSAMFPDLHAALNVVITPTKADDHYSHC